MEANTGVHECHSDDTGRREFAFIWPVAVASVLKRDSEMVQNVHDCRVTSRLFVTVPDASSDSMVLDPLAKACS